MVPEYESGLTPEMDGEVQQGYLMLLDICSSTAFLIVNELVHASKAVSEILRRILEAKEADVLIAKLEGDGLFFYTTERTSPPPDRLLGQVAAFREAFSQTKARLQSQSDCDCGGCRSVESLGIKAIVHYGKFVTEPIGPFCELLGPDVVVAHKLLKNTLPIREYLLLTCASIEKLRSIDIEPLLSFRTEQYQDIGAVEVGYCELSKASVSKPDAIAEPARQDSARNM